MKLADKIRTSDDAVAREVGGELVLLDLASGTYFGLNEVGGFIWKLLDIQQYTLNDLCDHIVAEFEVERDQVESDVLALAEDLAARGLVTVD